MSTNHQWTLDNDQAESVSRLLKDVLLAIRENREMRLIEELMYELRQCRQMGDLIHNLPQAILTRRYEPHWDRARFERFAEEFPLYGAEWLERFNRLFPQ